jgi:ell wall binding domain 2 (CWB2)
MSRPINADLPKAAPPAPAPDPKSAPGQDRSGGGRSPRRGATRRRRQPVPGVLKAIAALFALAVVFIVAAVLGGGSSEEAQSPSGPAPTPMQQDDPPSAEAPEASATELGFPAFATSNTTRVGGGDPASNAAAVALAIYPSTDETLRPSAVTLVGTDDWQGAVAAAVLTAEPVRAPLLFADGDDLPEPTAEALEALDPRGGADSKGAQAFAIGGAPSPGGLETTAVEPAAPAATAAAIARLRDRLHGKPPRHVVLAPLAQPDFAAPAAAWAARSGDPVLFTARGKLPAPTRAYLRRHRDVPVYVLGPSSAIPSDTIRQIAEVAGDVSRVSGEDPVANAVALARYDDGDFGWNVNDPGHGFVVARSESPLDAIAAAPLSASGTWGPLLLTDSADTLPEALRDYLLDVKPGYTTDPTRAFYNHVWVIGDEEAIEVSQQAEIDALAELARIGGEP